MAMRRWFVGGLAVVAVVLLAGRALSSAYADYQWYEALGAGALWRLRTETIAALDAAAFIATTLFAFANFYAVRHSVVSLVFPRRVGNLEIGEEVPGKYLMGAAAVLAIVLGLLLLPSGDNWTAFVLARTGQSFGELEPNFRADLGFFVNWLPFENMIWDWAFFAAVVVGAAVILLYALTPSLRWHRGTLHISGYVRRHLTVLAGLLLLLAAWSFRLDMYALVSSGSGPDGLFGFVDDKVGVTGDLVLALATLGASLVVIWGGFAGQFRLAGVAVLTIVALGLVVHEAAPFAVDHVGTEAYRHARDADYLGTRAAFTKRAFAIDSTPLDTAHVYPTLSAALPWIPAWEGPALSRAIDVNRAPDDPSSAIGWQTSTQGLIANVVSAPPPGASARAPWTVARVLAADADERGAPMRVGGAGTEASPADDTPLDLPIVYPGASPMAVVSDSLTHTTGVPLESFLARLTAAWSLQNLRLLSRDGSQPHPTLITHRDIRDRLHRFAPFFFQGRRVAPLFAGDSLYWAVDLYAASGDYPLARHIQIGTDDFSYLRHAATAVVQASTGDVYLVRDSVLDPIASTWVRLLPSMFTSWQSLPAGLRSLVGPPLDGLLARATAFGWYGPGAGAGRRVPVLDGADSALAGDELPIALRGGGSTAVALPLVDDSDRLRGLLIGIGGGTDSMVWFPLPSAGPRWGGLLDQLRSVDSAGNASRDGAVANGRVRTVPVRSGIAFLQPSYRTRPQSVPSINRVALVWDDSSRSVAPPFGLVPPVPALPSAASPEVKSSASALYAAMRDAMRRGDWVAFGRAFDALGRLLAPEKRR
jgi:uncharacterized protein